LLLLVTLPFSIESQKRSTGFAGAKHPVGTTAEAIPDRLDIRSGIFEGIC